MTAVWAGIDSGKRTHHCAVIDAAGRMVLSQRVANDESALLELITSVLALAGEDQVVWATDLNAGGAALLIALLANHGQQVLYIPGRIVHHAAATYRGDGKTDAKDARIIADQAPDAPRPAAGAQRGPDQHRSAAAHVQAPPIWSVTGSGRSTGYEPPCWSTSPRWRRRSTIPRRLR